MSRAKLSVRVIALVAGMGLSANAQGIVPGGWATQFGYQTFGSPGVSGGFAFGYSLPSYAANAYVGNGFGMNPANLAYGGYNPSALSLNRGNPYPINYGFNTASGQAVNSVDPLINSIRQTTRRTRRGR
jgi:hypothetical protein